MHTCASPNRPETRQPYAEGPVGDPNSSSLPLGFILKVRRRYLQTINPKLQLYFQLRRAEAVLQNSVAKGWTHKVKEPPKWKQLWFPPEGSVLSLPGAPHPSEQQHGHRALPQLSHPRASAGHPLAWTHPWGWQLIKPSQDRCWAPLTLPNSLLGEKKSLSTYRKMQSSGIKSFTERKYPFHPTFLSPCVLLNLHGIFRFLCVQQ